MASITITYLARHLADIVNRVAYRGERFTVLRGKRPVAEVQPVPQGRRLADLPGIFADLPALVPEDIDDFGDDMEAARRDVGPEDKDPWAS